MAVSLCSNFAESNEQDSIPPFIADSLKQAFEDGGTPAVKTRITEIMDSWKNEVINIGVTGNSGVGKSSFINAVLGHSHEDVGAADVDEIETTKKVTAYPHPNNEKLIFWDLPGVGTPNFLQDTYLEKIDVDKFDYFIILSAERFTENDLWLAENMKQKQKRFYFVRSKIDVSIANNKRRCKKHNEIDVMNKIRADCTKNLENVMGSGEQIPLFLVDNYDTNKYDFSLLSRRLIVDAPQMKREALILSFNFLNKSF
ncbi:T-cell-specific guanine nucleotide triphosphate-binding protein 2-like [Mercenaria mercenaria]|uniref:T-cell-specific guanine nucleotide triphosphate-binding protein 2-like n=1 Tax=Mercenaria mercenaria TaxID=6596 RepID=UPI00234EC9F1|nr:T-cell-specific guanine nucleotide triphosphate-binding protein 2-like [Mercenaria mercenaria]